LRFARKAPTRPLAVGVRLDPGDIVLGKGGVAIGRRNRTRTPGGGTIFAESTPRNFGSGNPESPGNLHVSRRQFIGRTLFVRWRAAHVERAFGYESILQSVPLIPFKGLRWSGV